MMVGELANWIVRYRRDNAFKGYSVAKIIDEIINCVDEDSFVISRNSKGILSGVAFGKKNNATKTMHVYDILTTEKGALANITKTFLTEWPDWKVTGNRKGKIVEFNLKSLNRLIYGK